MGISLQSPQSATTPKILTLSKGQVDIAEVDFFLCHEELLKQLGPLRSVVRDKTPNAANGTIGIDIVRMIQTFAKGW